MTRQANERRSRCGALGTHLAPGLSVWALGAFLSACGGKSPPASVTPVETPISGPSGSKPGTPEAAPAATEEAAEREEQIIDALDRGKAQTADGDTAGARSAFQEAASLGAPHGHYNLGVLEEWAGKYDEARRHYEAALGVDVEFGPAVVALANLRLRQGDASGAVRLAEERLARATTSHSLRNAANRVRLNAPGRAEAVIHDTKLILRDDEKNVEAMINLAAAYHQQEKYELSVAILENAQALDPQNPEIFARKALSQQGLKEGRRARMSLEEAVALPGGGSAEVHNNLGLIYHEAGDFVGAEEQFRAALARWPDMLEAQVNLGNALKGQQKFAEAEQVFRTALAQAKGSPEVMFNLGILYLDGQLANIEALPRLEKALDFFERYKQAALSRPADDPVDQYIAEAKKRVEVEQKRQEQLRQAPKPPPAPPADEAGEVEEDAENAPEEGEAQ